MSRDDLYDPALFDRIDRACDRFEAVWESDALERIEDYLEELAEPNERSSFLKELIRIDLHCRRERGDEPSVEEYRAQFPEDESTLRKVFTERDGRPHEPGAPAGHQHQRLGKFELLEHIGRGAFGTVYRARDTELDRIVAIKIPSRDAFPTKDDEDLFLREARSAGQLSHSGIVPVHEVGRANDFPFIVSEYVAGVTLGEALSDREFALREAAEIAAQVADALEHSHSKGVIHRDIKPSNIMLQQRETGPRALLMDFGLARRDEGEVTVTLDGQVLGTPKYMSPEQARGDSHRVDARSDVYCLGAVLYLLLTGEAPFRGNREMLLHQVLNEEPRPPREINNRIPRDLETICLKCLQKEPKRRYATAAELADDLRRWMQGLSISARPVGRLERSWRWCRRNPLVAGLSTAIVVALVVGTGVSIHFAVEATGFANDKSLLADKLSQALDDQRDATHRAEGLYYASQIARSQEAWNNGNVPAAWDFLNNCPTNCRGWEFEYLRGLFGSDFDELEGHAGFVWGVAVSPDGRRIASAGGDGSIRIWDTQTRQPVHSLTDHTDEVFGVAYSPDGRWIAGGGKDRTVIVWDADTGQRFKTLEGHAGPIKSVAFSPDGRRLASGGLDRSVIVWDVATGRQLQNLRGHTAVIRSVAYSPDGRWLVSGGKDAAIRIWDATSGKLHTSLVGHEDEVLSLAFAPDGRRLTSGGKDATVKTWDVETGEELLTIEGHTAPVRGVAYSGDGRWIAGTDGDSAIKVWNAETGEAVRTLQGSADTVLCVAFGPRGRWIVSGNGDTTVKIWDFSTRRAAPPLDSHLAAVTSVAYSRDGRWIASGSKDHTVKVWEATTARELLTFEGHTDEVLSAAFSPDGCWVASGGKGKTVCVWDARTGTEKFRLKGHAGDILCVTFGPHGRRIASGSADGTLKLWDAETGGFLGTLQGHTGAICSTAFSPDGRWIASGSADRTVKVWSAETGEELLTPIRHGNAVLSLVFSPDGQSIASGGMDHTVRVWDARTGRTSTTLDGHVADVKSVAFSPDGERLVSGSEDGTVKVWNPATGQEMITLVGHIGTVRGVAFSPDGGQIASASVDGDLRTWGVRSRL